MPKRFTATEKWADKWFRNLSPTHKLGYGYLLDNCDASGVIELDADLAEFQIGTEVDWNGLVEASEGRIEVLPNGRYWLTKFVEFQYGVLSEQCKPHKHVLDLLEKHGVSQRVSKGYPKGMDTHKEKEKEKEEEKDKVLEGGCGGKQKPRLEATAQSRFLSLWNSAEGVRKVTTVSGKRLSALAQRIGERVTLPTGEAVPWLDALEQAITKHFPLRCTRGSPDAWIPDGDFILRPDSVSKILEGKYDWSKHDAQQPARANSAIYNPNAPANDPSIGRL